MDADYEIPIWDVPTYFQWPISVCPLTHGKIKTIYFGLQPPATQSTWILTNSTFNVSHIIKHVHHQYIIRLTSMPIVISKYGFKIDLGKG